MPPRPIDPNTLAASRLCQEYRRGADRDWYGPQVGRVDKRVAGDSGPLPSGDDRTASRFASSGCVLPKFNCVHPNPLTAFPVRFLQVYLCRCAESR